MMHSQRGAALIVSLVVLVVLTLVAVNSMNNTILEEKMAGNLRSVSIGFQAAESALEAGESYLSQAAIDDFVGQDGLYESPTDGTNLWETVNWSSDEETRVFSGNLVEVASQPRYIIEEMPEVIAQGTSQVVGFEPAPELEYYRVTARGVGGNASTIVILQSTYLR